MMTQKVWLASLLFCIGISVAELCQEDQVEATNGSCFKFRLCKDRHWKEMNCSPPHQVYDSFQRKCVSIHSYCSSPTATENCKRDLCKNSNMLCIDGETKILGCKHYSECISGKWIQIECKEGETVKEGRCLEGTCQLTSLSCKKYIINGELINCESGYYFDKILSQCSPGFCQSHEDACKEGEVKGVKGTCKKYKQCVGGVFVDKLCSQCQNFDENSKKCVFIWDKPCSDGSVTTTLHPSSSSSSSTPPTSTSSDQTSIPTTVSPFKCLNGQRKPDYEHCSNYFQCDKEGNWKQKSCWWFLFYDFDVDSYLCKFWSAKCARK